MDSFKIILPIYYTNKTKPRKNKTFLVGLNWYRNAHYMELSAVKNYYSKMVKDCIDDIDFKINGEYGASYKLFYKHSGCDAMNVVSVIDKFTHDALQEAGIVKNDNVTHYIKTFSDKPIKDKDNPRIEITIKEIKA